MFSYERAQKVCMIGSVKVGGQPGENPPLLIGNMFQKGDVILKSRKEAAFDRKAAEERIREVERYSRETGVPCLIAMVANAEEEIKAYIDFFVGVTSMPFAIDIWQQKTRLAAARYVAEKKLQDRCLYNTRNGLKTLIFTYIIILLQKNARVQCSPDHKSLRWRP